MKQLYKVEVYKEEEVKVDNEEENELFFDPMAVDQESPVISLNALARTHTFTDFKTMRVSGAVMGQKVHILIDSGSTHNFIDVHTLQKLGCQVAKNPPIGVVVADGVESIVIKFV